MKRLLVQKLATACMIVLLITAQIRAGTVVPVSGEAHGVKLAVLMYHGFNSGGSETTYVLNAQSLENDIIWLKAQGFEFVTSRDLLNYCDYGTPLPAKSVMLTFDDGYLNNYVYAYPILQKYNAKAVISPIAYYSDYHTHHPDTNTAYAHMTWQQLKEMSDSGLADIQNHSYNMHSLQNGRRGSSRSEAESVDEYRAAFYSDLTTAHNLIKSATGVSPVAYAYPFGSVSKETKSVLRCCGYRISFSCSEGFNYITRQPDSLYMLKRFNRTPEKNAAVLLDGY